MRIKLPHEAISSKDDRFSIARNETCPEVNLSLQFIINCKVGWLKNGVNQQEFLGFIKWLI